ncbi:MAG: type II toxin-antitoxin system VapC family toxin [Candidatus Pacearchaeota archaeon]
MIFLDSWIWIEFFSEGKKANQSEKAIKELDKEGGIISSITLMEIDYRIRKKFGERNAEKLIKSIKSFENLEIMPVTEKVALYASELRNKYYTKNKKEISYADSIHLATAIMTGCKVLYSGDPDFKEID